MGAWGAGAFDNDDAADWDLMFENADLATGLRLITDALSAAAQADGAAYLDLSDGAPAVAAAEAVALINGQSVDESPYNESMRQWVTRARPGADAALTDLARRAVDRVAGQSSELSQLWSESGSSEWHSALAALKAKLDR
jgi:Domain of unknown function (DUF4259)